MQAGHFRNSRLRVVGVIGTTQALAWASSFYLPAVLTVSMARDLGLAPTWVYGAFSLSLWVTASLGPVVGRTIDARGARAVIIASNVLLATGLILLAHAGGFALLIGAWLVIGVGMAAGILEAAFAAMTRSYGADARGPITAIAIIAGFSSTLGWPLSAYMEHALGWRAACLVWAAANVVLALPLNAWALAMTPPPTLASPISCRPSPASPDSPDGRMRVLAWVFGLGAIVSNGIATNLPGLFVAMGVSSGAAVAAASLMGLAQAGARLVEFAVSRWTTPLRSARVAAGFHPLAAAMLGIAGTSMCAGFAILQGAGNGIFTVIRGTLPLALFGADGYGSRIGTLSFPARMGQAVAPFLFGWVIERYGGRILWISSALSLLALTGLFHGSLSHCPDRRTRFKTQGAGVEFARRPRQ